MVRVRQHPVGDCSDLFLLVRTLMGQKEREMWPWRIQPDMMGTKSVFIFLDTSYMWLLPQIGLVILLLPIAFFSPGGSFCQPNPDVIK